MNQSVLYSSPFVPPEWIAAHGLQPIRLLAEATPAADVWQGVCPFAGDFVRTAAQADDVAGILLTSTCDQMRRMAELLDRLRRVPVFLMTVPATWQGPAAGDLYAAELRRLGRFLVDCGGAWPTNDTLVAQLCRYDASRQALREAVPQMTARAFCESLHDLARTGEFPPGPRTCPGEGFRVGLVGGPLRRQDFWLYDLLEGFGAAVVLDATETGERSLPAMFDPARLQADPLAELVRTYFETIPDAFRRPDTQLYEYLRRVIDERAVQGLVLVRCVWCDQWHAQCARLKACLGLPLVEIDLGDQDHQLQRTRTRLETFVSILR